MLYRLFFEVQELVRLLLVRTGIKKTSILPIRTVQRAYVRSLKALRVSTRPPQSVLLVSQLAEGSTSHARLKAIKALFPTVEAIDILPFMQARGLDHVLTNHLFSGRHIRELNDLIRDKASVIRPDLLWVDRGLYVWPSILQRLRAAGCGWMIHYSPDNHQAPGNQSRHYFENVPLYDVHVTTKRDDVAWLKQIGARRVEWLGKAFDPEVHRPIRLSPADREHYGCEVGFTGHWEPSREELLLWLSKQGLNIKVWGGGWHRARHPNHPLFRDCPHLVGDSYAKAIQGAKIQLCLVSNWVRDLSTARSIEIPACGTFMLAERTVDHQDLFKEGVEAEFYADRDELLKKIRHYLKNTEARERIAEAGRLRCWNGYRWEDRLNDLSRRLWPTSIGKVA